MRKGQQFRLNLPGYLINGKIVEVVKGVNNYPRDVTVQFVHHFWAGKNVYRKGDTMEVAPGELQRIA